MSRVQKRWLIGGVLGLIVLGLIVGAIRPYKRALGAQPSASPEVEVAEVERQDVPIYGEWIGTLDGLVNADVRAQVARLPAEAGLSGGWFRQAGRFALPSGLETNPHDPLIEVQLEQSHRLAAGGRRTNLPVSVSIEPISLPFYGLHRRQA
jgi:hypothetical protein